MTDENIIYDTELRVRYRALMRPPGPGAVPRDGLVESRCIESISPSGHHVWGWVVYNRYLTDEEINHYDLEFATAERIIV